MRLIILPWMRLPPDPNMELTTWSGFHTEMAAAVILCVTLVTTAIIILYSLSAHRKRIHTPKDLFAPYTPMRWLLLSVVSAVAMFLVYAIRYERFFSGARVSYTSGAPWVALWAGFLTLLAAYFLMWLPFITPARFKYRPRRLLYQLKGARS